MTIISQLDSYLKKFPTYKVLQHISKYSIDLYLKNKSSDNYPAFVNGIKYDVTITQQGLAYIAFRTIYASNDGKGRNFNYDDLMRAISIYSDLYEPFIKDNDLPSFMLRMAHEQFPRQVSNYKYLLSRYYTIFNNSGINKKFNEIFGISMINYIFAGMATYFPLIKNKYGCITIGEKFRDENNILTRENIEKFLSLTSADYQKIKCEANNQITLPDYKKYELNPLIKYPIIKTDIRFSSYHRDCPYIIPDASLLLNKITGGIYWIMRDYYKDIKSYEFLNAFGELFKKYVGTLLKIYFAEENVKDLDEVIKDTGTKKADWWVKLKDIELIIECKSSLIPEYVKRVFNLDSLRNALNKMKFSKGVSQLRETEKILPNILGIRRYHIIITLEDIYFWEKPEIKSLINNEINKFYIMSVRELEEIEPWIMKYGMKRIFQEKEKIDREDDIRKRRDFISICNYIDDKIISDNNFLDDIYYKIFSTKLKQGEK